MKSDLIPFRCCHCHSEGEVPRAKGSGIRERGMTAGLEAAESWTLYATQITG